MVNAAGHRSTPADHGGDQRSTVAVNDGRRWRTTVDCRWTTVDHHRTTGQQWLVGWSKLGMGRVWIGSGSEIASPEVTHEIHDSKGCTFLSEEFLDIDSFNDIHPHFDDDLFDSKGEKIKESELFRDQLDLPCDILSEYDSFASQDFSRDDDLPSPDNEDKVFNPGILIHKKSVKIVTRVAQEKKLAVSYASLMFEDFDPPFYELLVFKEVPNSMRLLPFSSENEEKVFKPGIYTSKKIHSCFLLELSHPGYHVFKVNLIFITLMNIFHVQSGKNTPPLDVILFHFYPP
nr:hypothetical protein [Tanacetum cinerariifolium]